MHRAVFVHDARLGHRYRPSSTVRVPHERGCYWIHTNRAGFRSIHELDAPRRAAQPRVLVVGDSFTAGDGVEEHERWCDLLAAWHGLEVHNLALSGASLEQSTLILEDYVQTLAPDQVWISMAVHTIARLGHPDRLTIDRLGRPVRCPRPWFEVGEEGLEVRGVPVQDISAPLGPRRAAPLDRAWRVALADRIAELLDERYRSRLMRLRRRAEGVWRRLAQRRLGCELDPDYLSANSSRWRLIERLVERCASSAYNAQVVIVPLPTAAYISDRLTPHYSRRFASLAAPERRVYVADPTEGLRAQRDAAPFSFQRDGHPSPAGHESIARALSKVLRAQGLLGPTSNSKLRTEPPPPTTYSATLTIGWDHGAFARLDIADELSVEHRESIFFDEALTPGTIPYAANAASLEAIKPRHAQLGEVVLLAPHRLEPKLAEASTVAPLVPHVRWYGAAERDVRRLLDYTGPVLHRSLTESDWGAGSWDPSDDVDGVWLQRALAAVLTWEPGPERVRRFQRLCKRWEAATRRCRASVALG